MKHWAICAFAIAALGGCSLRLEGNSTATAPAPADVVLRGARLIDPAEDLSGSSIAIRDGRIVAVGSDEQVRAYYGARTRVLDAKGGVIVPGLQDAHGHLFGLGADLEQADLRGAKSEAEMAARVGEFARTHPDGWVQGRGWDQNLWPGAQFPTKASIDAVSGNRPAVLSRVDGHAVLVNSAALRLAGVTSSTKDPDGGRIVRDAQGEPTGVLVDNAESLVTRVMPPASDDELERRALAAQSACLAAGLTAVHDAGESAAERAVLRRLDAGGLLKLRIYGMASASDMPKEPARQDRYTLRAVKAYADGALGSRGAALLEPYEDEPGHRGLLVTSEEGLRAIAKTCRDRGLQLCVHAIGDRGNRLVLDIFEQTFADARERLRSERWRIEHCQIVSPDDFMRFKDLGIIASMQPTHATSDGPWAPRRVGTKRMEGAYAWRKFQDLGVVLAFGSDFPVESHDPRFGLYAARTRRAPGADEGGPFGPSPPLGARETLAGFTKNAAFASFREDDLGRLAVGYRADLTVFSGDPLAADRTALDARVIWTFVDGELVYPAQSVSAPR